jgi:hypothetical protein
MSSKFIVRGGKLANGESADVAIVDGLSLLLVPTSHLKVAKKYLPQIQ